MQSTYVRAFDNITPFHTKLRSIFLKSQSLIFTDEGNEVLKEKDLQIGTRQKIHSKTLNISNLCLSSFHQHRILVLCIDHNDFQDV